MDDPLHRSLYIPPQIEALTKAKEESKKDPEEVENTGDNPDGEGQEGEAKEGEELSSPKVKVIFLICNDSLIEWN